MVGPGAAAVSGVAWGGPCFCHIPGYTLFCFGSYWEGPVIASSPCYVIKKSSRSAVQAENYNLRDVVKCV